MNSYVKTVDYEEDLMRKISEPTIISCPKCGMVKILLSKLSAANFKLKGSGWYETDFKNKNEFKRFRNKERCDKTNQITKHQLRNKMFKKNILTGLLVLIPIVLTLWVLNYANSIFRSSLIISCLKNFSHISLFGGAIPGYGVIVTLVGVFLNGCHS